MRTIKYIRLLIISALSLSVLSCDITLYPEDKVTPDSYFKTETDLELFTNTFYTYLPGEGVYADEADIIIHAQLNKAVSGQRVVPETSSGIDGWGWGLLRQINFYLDNSYRCEDADARNHYDGLARFFRAYFYYRKVCVYGDVPWYDQVIGSADKELLNKPRDSRKFVMSKVLEDLDFAIANMRDTKEIYRVTKWTALALKSRIMLFEGTFRKYHELGDWEECLEECVKASEEFINTSGYGLYTEGNTPYATLFTTLNAPELSAEVILARDYDYGMGLIHKAQIYTNSPGSGCGGATKRLVDAYLMKNGTRFTDKPGYQTMSFIEECKDRDPRMAQTLRTPNYQINGKSVLPNLHAAKLGYQLTKYYVSQEYDGHSEIDLPLFRTAEVYLNLAEAKAELGTLEQKDLDETVNKLRTRAKMTGMMNLVQANSDPDEWLMTAQYGYPNLATNHGKYKNTKNLGVILEIRRERTIELVMEGHRYYDIMRWKEGKVFEQPFIGMYIPGPGAYDFNGDGIKDFNFTTTNDPGDPNAGAEEFKLGENLYVTGGSYGNLVMHANLTRVWNENRDYLYPLPREDRKLTNGILTQNPGWDDGLGF